MRYVPNMNTSQLVFFDESKISEQQAQEIIGQQLESRDGAEWEKYNILDGQDYRIVDFEGKIDKYDPEEDSIDPVWYCYQIHEGDIEYDHGSYDFLTALNAARKVFCKKVAEIGLRENYCYAEVDVL